jgi:hypothetical protein
MIGDFDIKNKDFSLTLPMVISKIEIVSNSIQGGIFEDDVKNSLFALGNMLDDVVNDLNAINEALYGG